MSRHLLASSQYYTVPSAQFKAAYEEVMKAAYFIAIQGKYKNKTLKFKNMDNKFKNKSP